MKSELQQCLPKRPSNLPTGLAPFIQAWTPSVCSWDLLGTSCGETRSLGNWVWTPERSWARGRVGDGSGGGVKWAPSRLLLAQGMASPMSTAGVRRGGGGDCGFCVLVFVLFWGRCHFRFLWYIPHPQRAIFSFSIWGPGDLYKHIAQIQLPPLFSLINQEK